MTPTSGILSIQKKIGGGSTARKDPISATNHQWGMKNSPTDGSLLYIFLTNNNLTVYISFTNQW